MKAIWKTRIRIRESQTIYLPKGTVFLSIQKQDNRIFVCSLVDPNEPICVKRKIVCLGTWKSFNLPENSTFIGTVQKDGSVWHFFELNGPFDKT